MLSWWSKRSTVKRNAEEIYGAVVAFARRTEFYRDYGIPDTMNGRYEMLVLGLFLVLERLRAEGASAQDLSRLTLERFCTDMDDSMREIGIGDMGVPRRVKRAAAGFYERAVAYREALASPGTEPFAAAFGAFLAEGSPAEAAAAGSAPDALAVASEARALESALRAADIETVISGRALRSEMPNGCRQQPIQPTQGGNP
ncbi:MAG: ubiquinol-cytochrome C chaperone family protein [Hyphomicrobiaceae bacterium]